MKNRKTTSKRRRWKRWVALLLVCITIGQTVVFADSSTWSGWDLDTIEEAWMTYVITEWDEFSADGFSFTANGSIIRVDEKVANFLSNYTFSYLDGDTVLHTYTYEELLHLTCVAFDNYLRIYESYTPSSFCDANGTSLKACDYEELISCIWYVLVNRGENRITLGGTASYEADIAYVFPYMSNIAPKFMLKSGETYVFTTIPYQQEYGWPRLASETVNGTTYTYYVPSSLMYLIVHVMNYIAYSSRLTGKIPSPYNIDETMLAAIQCVVFTGYYLNSSTSYSYNNAYTWINSSSDASNVPSESKGWANFASLVSSYYMALEVTDSRSGHTTSSD